MSQAAFPDGPAFRTLMASAGRPAFTPPIESITDSKARDRIWELAETLHCSIVGTCLTTADGRSLLAKLGVPDARTMSEHRLHGQVVHIASRREGGGKLLQKMLDRRHEREVRRFDKATTTNEVRALWRESLEQGEIPGAYWAAITHPATDWTLVQDIFGEVHMLSHLVGQSNRADIRRLRQLEAELAERDETIATQEARIRTLTGQCVEFSERERSAETTRALSAITEQSKASDPSSVGELEARLAREQAHTDALEQRIAVLMQADGRMSSELETESARCRALEAELAALEAGLDEDETDETAVSGTAHGSVADRTILYVGGRPRQVARLRRYVEERGGHLLSHDGGIDESMTLLPGLVGRSERVLFPMDCVSHEAAGMVKRFCDAQGKAFQPVRSASLASFVRALVPAHSQNGDG